MRPISMRDDFEEMLAHLDIAAFPGDLLNDGNHHAAGAAPGSPEVQQDGFVGVHYFILEIGFIDIDS